MARLDLGWLARFGWILFGLGLARRVLRWLGVAEFVWLAVVWAFGRAIIHFGCGFVWLALIGFGASIWVRFSWFVFEFAWLAVVSLGLCVWISFGFDLALVLLGLHWFGVTPAFWLDLALVWFGSPWFGIARAFGV